MIPPATWTPSLEDYHKDPAIGSSMLSTFRDNRRLFHALYVAKTMEPEGATASMKLGTLVHAMIEGASSGGVPVYLVVNGDRRGKEYKDAIKSGMSPAVVYPAAEVENAKAIAYAILEPKTAAARAARGVLVDHPGPAEYSFKWQHSPHVELKVRFDRLCEVPGVGFVQSDLKTSKGPAPEEFAQSVKAYHYAHALALREMAAEQLGITLAASFLVAVRSEAPFEVAVYQMDGNALGHAREELRVELMELEELLAAEGLEPWLAPWEGSVQPLTVEEIT